jgi:hypothetical protein
VVQRRFDFRRQDDQRAVDRPGEPLVVLAQRRAEAPAGALPLSQALLQARAFWAAVYKAAIDSVVAK